MLENNRWSDEIREISINAFLSQQSAAATDTWYVPYKTGVALINQSNVLMISHLGRDPKIGNLDILRTTAQGRHNLITSGIYDCVALTLEIGSQLKLIFHAHGASSMLRLLAGFGRELPQIKRTNSPKIPTELTFAYNPSYVTQILAYEWLYFYLVSQLKPTIKHRVWVNEKTEIVI